MKRSGLPRLQSGTCSMLRLRTSARTLHESSNVHARIMNRRVDVLLTPELIISAYARAIGADGRFLGMTF